VVNVVDAQVENRRDIERVIANMRDAGLSDVVVLGYDKVGAFWADINFSDGPNALWLLELARAKVLAAGGA
jgi:hypothetical protein